jgi:hypothetical protein
MSPSLRALTLAPGESAKSLCGCKSPRSAQMTPYGKALNAAMGTVVEAVVMKSVGEYHPSDRKGVVRSIMERQRMG